MRTAVIVLGFVAAVGVAVWAVLVAVAQELGKEDPEPESLGSAYYDMPEWIVAIALDCGVATVVGRRRPWAAAALFALVAVAALLVSSWNGWNPVGYCAVPALALALLNLLVWRRARPQRLTDTWRRGALDGNRLPPARPGATPVRDDPGVFMYQLLQNRPGHRHTNRPRDDMYKP